MKLPARLTDPWFQAHFFAEVGIAGPGTYRNRFDSGFPYSFAQSQGLFLWCPCGYGLLDKEGKERYPLNLSLNRGRPHGALIVFGNPPLRNHAAGRFRPQVAATGTRIPAGPSAAAGSKT